MHDWIWFIIKSFSDLPCNFCVSVNGIYIFYSKKKHANHYGISVKLFNRLHNCQIMTKKSFFYQKYPNWLFTVGYRFFFTHAHTHFYAKLDLVSRFFCVCHKYSTSSGLSLNVMSLLNLGMVFCLFKLNLIGVPCPINIYRWWIVLPKHVNSILSATHLNHLRQRKPNLQEVKSYSLLHINWMMECESLSLTEYVLCAWMCVCVGSFHLT